ncbi:hypothetical protein KDA_04990 [Dictyobacter alpinus]|uniref:AI-2E family transporter n=1 Tax=Dictyobacter alpinus TaxID=2014873 RepID=A0A402B0Y0_9CHLR|nr:AI-2E family transporter [Dictyobacter alpinus]GCE25015.1 hypothetical protein KDA_04990 [Dictyobacter alpinus]
MGQINWQQRRDILISIICIGIIAWTLWNLVNQFIDAVFLLLLSMAIAFLITPVTNFFERQGASRLVATIISYVFVLLILGLFSYILVVSFVNQVTGFSDTVVGFTRDIPARYSSFLQFLREQAGIPQTRIDQTLAQLNSQVTGFANAAVTNTINIIIVLTSTFLNFLIVLMVSFYLTLDGKRIRDSIVSIMPKRSLSTTLLFEDALTRVVGNYIRGQLTLALVIGVAVAIVCWATGLGQFALIFGVLGFLFETIPMIGPGLASISPILASLLLPNPFPRTLIVIVCFIFIQLLESNILGPRIVGHAVGLHPVVSIMSLLVFARLFGSSYGAFGGAVGALVATPIVAAAWVVVASLYRSARGETADQILARKRAPWSLKRPSPSSSRAKSSGPGTISGKLLRKSVIPRSVTRNNVISVTAPESPRQDPISGELRKPSDQQEESPTDPQETQVISNPGAADKHFSSSEDKK